MQVNMPGYFKCRSSLGSFAERIKMHRKKSCRNGPGIYVRNGDDDPKLLDILKMESMSNLQFYENFVNLWKFIKILGGFGKDN